jgi:hypothetical protein
MEIAEELKNPALRLLEAGEFVVFDDVVGKYRCKRVEVLAADRVVRAADDRLIFFGHRASPALGAADGG